TVTIDHLLPSVVLNTTDVASLLVAHPWTLIKIDPSGEPLWIRHFDQPHSEEVYRITAAAPAPDDGFYLLGNYGEDVTLKTESDALLIRVDSEGAVVWSQRFGSETEGERGWTLVPYLGGVAVAGSTWNSESASQWTAFSILFDDDGAVMWSKKLLAPLC